MYYHGVLLCKNYPLSRIYFITVKDNADKWKIGKVNDWIRKYSKCYFIVKGTSGGTHYHMIAGIEPKVNVRCINHIHFNIQNLSGPRQEFLYDEFAAEDKRKAIHFRRVKFERQVLGLDEESVNIITKISNMILKHFRKKANVLKGTLKQTAKEERVQPVYDYLLKNLDEERFCLITDEISEQRYEYKDYIYK